MIKVSHAFIRGFVSECYRLGFHEKQAAALLQAKLDQMDANGGSPIREMMRRVIEIPGNVKPTK